MRANPIVIDATDDALGRGRSPVALGDPAPAQRRGGRRLPSAGRPARGPAAARSCRREASVADAGLASGAAN